MRIPTRISTRVSTSTCIALVMLLVAGLYLAAWRYQHLRLKALRAEVPVPQQVLSGVTAEPAEPHPSRDTPRASLTQALIQINQQCADSNTQNPVIITGTTVSDRAVRRTPLTIQFRGDCQSVFNLLATLEDPQWGLRLNQLEIRREEDYRHSRDLSIAMEYVYYADMGDGL